MKSKYINHYHILISFILIIGLKMRAISIFLWSIVLKGFFFVYLELIDEIRREKEFFREHDKKIFEANRLSHFLSSFSEDPSSRVHFLRSLVWNYATFILMRTIVWNLEILGLLVNWQTKMIKREKLVVLPILLLLRLLVVSDIRILQMFGRLELFCFSWNLITALSRERMSKKLLKMLKYVTINFLKELKLVAS